jgi:hypothetical protein
MTTPPIDYASILADLEAKKTALEATIASIRGAIAVGSLGQSGDGTGYTASALPTSMNGGEVPAGAFFGKSIPDAAKLYLEIIKKKQTSKEIAGALLKGGMESASKNFPSIVHSILDRARKAANPAFVKLGTQWGLASWYPNFVPSAAKPSSNKKLEGKTSKKKARSKSASTKTPAITTIEPASQASEKKNGKEPSTNAKRIMDVLLAKPGVELGLDAIAQQTGIPVRNVGLLVNNFIRGKNPKVEKTSSGKYRVVSTAKRAVA